MQKWQNIMQVDQYSDTGCLGLGLHPRTIPCPWVPRYILFISYRKERFKEYLLLVTKWTLTQKEFILLKIDNSNKNIQNVFFFFKFAENHILEIFGNKFLG